MIVASVSKTHRLLVVDEAFSMCGIGAEIAATIMESAFDELDAPVGRLHTEAVAQPFAPVLEKSAVVTAEKIIAAARDTIAGKPRPPRRPTGGQTGERQPHADLPAENGHPPTPSVGKTPSPSSPTPPAARKSSIAGTAINMPHGDLTVSEARLIKWVKGVGATVKKGEGIVEVETDKAAMEVESPVDGVLVEVLVPEGAVVKFGEQLATVRPS
jgi:2-oxoisovalerate dehydrogenase E1 component